MTISRPGRSGRTYGSRAVVTGAGSGIGRAFARELARRGGQVVCADLEVAAAKHTVVGIEAEGGAAYPVHCDVADAEQVVKLAEAARAWLPGPVDLVINNAGVGSGGQLIGQTALTDWRHTVGVNLWGVVHGCHVFAPGLREHGCGGIINVASAASFAAAPRMGAYNVSKAGVLALSETLAAELSGTDVVVSVLCPTFVKTDILAGGRIDEAAARAANQLMRLTGVTPEHVARVALDAHERGRLYLVPQLDGRLIWRAKRLLPTPYTRLVGLVGRLLP